jgi:GNAT superfamily N-acetyltransferase
LLPHRRARRQGVGAARWAAAEHAAREGGKTPTVLDTASAEAERLYARAGRQRCGAVPSCVLLPHCGLRGTNFFCRKLA